MPIIFSDSDISWAEEILLPPGEQFDEERRAVVKCLDTKDILACPGSGKTTALLAKLLILSRKMPLENNRGICVLTHTNVAINEIKNKAGVYSSKLFSYPNHFGTIQSFVDKYLAIPAYINMFNRRPSFINNDIYFDRMERSRKYLGNKTKAFCFRSGLKNYPYSLKFEDFSLDNNGICKNLNLDSNDSTQNLIYDKLLWLKKMILKDGILSYNDAYFLAAKYIIKHPNLKDLFRKRFAYFFIDEMQDSNTTQSTLLNEIFNDNVVAQKIGDLNQSIFDYDADLECGWYVNNDCSLCITGSKRFPSSIASKVENLCVCRQTIAGNGRQDEISPVIIVYNDNTIQQVLNKFGEIIIKNNLHQHEKGIFKAVGWVGKSHDKEKTIPSYWDSYSKEIKVKRTDFSNLKSYLAPQSDCFVSSNGANFYKKRLVEAFLKCLRIAEITDNDMSFTDKKLQRYISEKDSNFYNDFRVRLAKWCLQIHRQEEVFEAIKFFLTNEFRDFFNYQVNNELSNFINSSDSETVNEEDQQSNNIYKYSSGTTEIEIEVSTIHGVKGETHTATCYLETFFYDYDIKRIMNYMKGEYIEPTKKRIIKNLKMAFVGMSRPSHLLCVAVHRDSISGQEQALQINGWDINCELCTSSNE
ncbi:MAG: UvrD-helicase domain-containing protein [Candidatus Latescibacteria bacterium]|nr:UvrD-helicase domain-containing protein [Candidatus Latescibacterota bacterium]